MNLTLDQATLHRKVVTVFISSSVLKQAKKIVDSLATQEVTTDFEKDYYSGLFAKLDKEKKTRSELADLFPPEFKEEIPADACMCLGTFSAEHNTIERKWSTEKILALFPPGLFSEEDRGFAMYRKGDHRTPEYKEVDQRLYSLLPHEDDSGELVMPKKELRIWTVDADMPEPVSIVVLEKKNLQRHCSRNHRMM